VFEIVEEKQHMLGGKKSFQPVDQRGVARNVEVEYTADGARHEVRAG
jgi:hypothetical protein